MFYFTSFHGNKESLLYYFYLSLYKVFLGETEDREITDGMPISTLNNNRISAWFQDFVAPFHTYIRVWYSIICSNTIKYFDTDRLILESKIQVSIFNKTHLTSESTITIKDNCIREFTFTSKKTKIQAKWLNT